MMEVSKVSLEDAPVISLSPPKPPAEPVTSPLRDKASLGTKVDRMLELLGEDPQSMLEAEASRKTGKKVKPFKLPRKVSRQVQRGLKKGMVYVAYIRENRAVIPVATKVQDGRYFLDGAWHNADPKSLFLWKGKIPMFIQPAWSINPVRTWKEGEVDVGNSADAERVVLDVLERSDTLQKKKGMKGMTWVFVAIGLIVAGYLLFGGGF